MKKQKIAMMTLVALLTMGSISASAASIEQANLTNPTPSVQVNIEQSGDMEYTATIEEVGESGWNDETDIMKLKTLTEEEKAQLIEAHKAVNEIYNEVNKIYEKNIPLTAEQEKEIELLYEKANKIMEKVMEIQDKADIELFEIYNEEYVNSLTILTAEEKSRYLEAIKTSNQINNEISAIYQGRIELSQAEAKKVDVLEKQLQALFEGVKDIEKKLQDMNKISHEEYVNGFTMLNAEEKAVLVQTYNEIDDLCKQINDIWGYKRRISAHDQKRVDELSAQMDGLHQKIEIILEKVYQD